MSLVLELVIAAGFVAVLYGAVTVRSLLALSPGSPPRSVRARKPIFAGST